MVIWIWVLFRRNPTRLTTLLHLRIKQRLPIRRKTNGHRDPPPTAGTDPRQVGSDPDLLVNVFRRLSLEDQWKGAMLTCRSWLEAARDPSLLASFDLEAYFDAAGDSAQWWTAEFERRIDAMVRSVAVWGAGSVKVVRVRHCLDRSLNLLAERSPNLEVLSIGSSRNATDASIYRIALSCPMLRELDISNCYNISYLSFRVIGKNCPNLIILKRNFMNWINSSQHAEIVPDEYPRPFPKIVIYLRPL